MKEDNRNTVVSDFRETFSKFYRTTEWAEKLFSRLMGSVNSERGISTKRFQIEFESVLPSIATSLRALQMPRKLERAQKVSLADVLAELEAAEKEFGITVECNQCGRVKVEMVTDPITLSDEGEELSLGTFEISLNLSPDNRMQYTVVALDPNPAGDNEDVTHPHVKDNDLCEGDAHTAIQAALENGRILDFFTLVSAVLNTYNPDSPFVKIEDWHGGNRCENCDDRVSEDEGSNCADCENFLCAGCTEVCESCDRVKCRRCFDGGECSECGNYICSSCLEQCDNCTNVCCSSCTRACEGCEKRLCSKCLKGDLCEECNDKQRDEDELANEEGRSTPSREPFEDQLGVFANASAEADRGEG
jgi:hypothetical protein